MELAVKRVINFLVAPLRLISRSVALLAVALLLIGASGQWLAASSPFSPGDASVGDTDWFRSATADNAMPVGLQRADSWLRPGPAAVLTRVVRDPSGKAAGVV